MPFIAILLGLTLLLAPSAWFARRFQSMPQLGAYHDDAVLWLSAQSLAENHGYRIPQLPENPAQTKYPPLYPALLSLVWRLAGAFPANLRFLTAVQWSFCPIFLGMAWFFFRQSGFGVLAAYGLTLILALCPITIILAVSPLTELPFSTVLLAVMVLLGANRDRSDGRSLDARWSLIAGLLAAVAFLIRTNALVLAVSVPLLLILERRVRAAITFLIPIASAIAGWQLWCLRNAFAAKDNVTSYYTSYIGFYLRTFSWGDLPHRMWVNFASIIEALAQLVFFSVDHTYAVRVLGWLLTVTATAGVVTLFRSGVRHYPAFAALFVFVLVLWQYPSDTRFVYPLFPLYLAGLATKLREIAMLGVTTWRRKPGADRVVVVVMLSLIALIGLGSFGSALHGLTSVLPDYFADRQTQRAEMMPVYAWIKDHTNSDKTFAVYDDTLLYLNTGRRGYMPALLPSLIYGQDTNAIQDYVLELGSFWRAKQVAYVLVTKYDFRRDLQETALGSLRNLVQDRKRFQPLYSDDTAQVYGLPAEPAPSHAQVR
jgi:hypothetical protein